MRKGKPEAAFQRSVISYLEVRYKCLVLRINQGGMKKADKTRQCGYRYVPFTRGVKGVSDIIACSPEGIFIAIECKAPGGKLTDDQAAFLERVREVNGIAIVADTIPSFEEQYRTKRRNALRKLGCIALEEDINEALGVRGEKTFYETLDDMDKLIEEGKNDGHVSEAH